MLTWSQWAPKPVTPDAYRQAAPFHGVRTPSIDTVRRIELETADRRMVWPRSIPSVGSSWKPLTVGWRRGKGRGRQFGRWNYWARQAANRDACDGGLRALTDSMWPAVRGIKTETTYDAWTPPAALPSAFLGFLRRSKDTHVQLSRMQPCIKSIALPSTSLLLPDKKE
ncbi:hypothetical protein BHE74_00012587 [Ensete ventricosum]|nr:hypothetical protein GW17_00006685 [Ensete ventricosum]RWW79146.1 hypothetical protein BHE74_00012587 [Ensete ventricosum]RZR75593.1 hypothetical protein BHM03_00000006 [Ensete ventricosum]